MNQMELTIPVNSKFACIALNNCDLDDNLTFPFKLNEGTWVYGTSPIFLEDHWKEILGTYRYEELCESNIFIVCFKPSKTPEILDHETEGLKTKIFANFYTLFLNGIFYYDAATLVSGAFLPSYVNVREVASVDWHPDPHLSFDPISLTKESLLFSQKTGDLLCKIQKEEEKYIRVKKGFNAWKNGLGGEFLYMDERLHQFVRATEGFLKLREGKSRKDFIFRGSLILKNDSKNRTILEELYDLRSCTEHMNDFEEVLKIYSADEREDVGQERTRQSLLFANHIYKKLFTDSELLKKCENDAMLEPFWKKRETEIRKDFGYPLDLFI